MRMTKLKMKEQILQHEKQDMKMHNSVTACLSHIVACSIYRTYTVSMQICHFMPNAFMHFHETLRHDMTDLYLTEQLTHSRNLTHVTRSVHRASNIHIKHAQTNTLFN